MPSQGIDQSADAEYVQNPSYRQANNYDGIICNVTLELQHRQS